MYRDFALSLQTNSEYNFEYLDKKYKIVFSNLSTKDLEEITMINNWSKYNCIHKINQVVRRANIFQEDKPIFEWIDFICLDDKILNNYRNNSLTYLNGFTVVERLIDSVTLIWDTNFKPTYFSKFNNITNLDELLNIISPPESINVFSNFSQKINLKTKKINKTTFFY